MASPTKKSKTGAKETDDDPTGRGRGQARNIGDYAQIVAEQEERRSETQQRIGTRPPPSPGSSAARLPMFEAELAGSSQETTSGSQPSGTSSPSSGDKTVRGRGGFQQVELHTVPANITNVRSNPNADGQRIHVLCNFIKISPMKNRNIYQYRVDFKPNIESLDLRKRLFRTHSADVFTEKVIFDGVNDARSANRTENETIEKEFPDPTVGDGRTNMKMRIKRVGTVSGQFELIRVYNMHMKSFLRSLGFYLVTNGAYVHPQLSTPIGNDNAIRAVRGYKTAANVYDHDTILMNLESCHKLTQTRNVLEYMIQLRANNRANSVEVIKNALRGKLVVTNYNKVIYKIEEVDFSKNPMETFHDDKNNRDITYKDYYQTRYDRRVTDQKQPLLLALRNNTRRRGNENEEEKDIYLVPEFCNITGLTDEQKADNKLRMDLVRASQITPSDRVEHLRTFLEQLHNNRDVRECLMQWGYEYGKDALDIPARILPTERIGIGKTAAQSSNNWPQVDPKNGGFDNLVMREKCAKIPPLPKLKIIIGSRDFGHQSMILGRIKSGFDKVGLQIPQPEVIRMEGHDTAQNFVQHVKRLPDDTTAAIIILPNQNKERYDAIKKVASVDRGMITQVITSRLMTDERKAGGAGVKIGVQIVAKLGGEPWYINLPLAQAMVCGYDTYHDTTQRGRSFGAFVASMNNRYSKWWSKADCHDHADELSSHMSENLKNSINKYKEYNGEYPDRLIIYRDGVGDGQLQHVVNVEMKQLIEVVKAASSKIRLSIIIVNKRIGARFYWKNSEKSIFNCPPGTVVDDVVTRKERYDFYLISQSTRQGTVAPTYYNIIFDESGLDPSRHQALAYKMCFAYYNWTGTVRVPAPCQYAHKLALLCGEHLHFVPNANLDDRLHFL